MHTASALAQAEGMLHVSVVSPPEQTDRLLRSLSSFPGVTNLVVLRGAAARPEGDAVQFDVLSRSANPVLEQLRDFTADRSRSVIVESVDATLAPPGWLSSVPRSYHGERAPIWELVEARIREGAEYAPSFFILLVFAGLIGASGILTNSQILIVGAMVVGPEYSAIISVALGLDRRYGRAIRTGLLALMAGFVLAIIVTLLFALCIRWSGRTPRLYLLGIRPVSDLINSPNLFSIVVAVIAGIVGAVSLTEARTGALVGVFISVTTIPAAADIGVSAAYGSWTEAGGSAAQLLLNVALLIITGAVALRAQRVIWRRWTQRAGHLSAGLARCEPTVLAPGSQQLAVRAAVNHPACAEDHDLVHLVEPIELLARVIRRAELAAPVTEAALCCSRHSAAAGVIDASRRHALAPDRPKAGLARGVVVPNLLT